LDFFFGELTIFLPKLILVFFLFFSFATHHFFKGTPTYPPTPPTYLPPFLLPAHLPPSFYSPLTCARALVHHQHLRFNGTKV
jgi:hypothetical protein